MEGNFKRLVVEFADISSQLQYLIQELEGTCVHYEELLKSVTNYNSDQNLVLPEITDNKEAVTQDKIKESVAVIDKSVLEKVQSILDEAERTKQVYRVETQSRSSSKTNKISRQVSTSHLLTSKNTGAVRKNTATRVHKNELKPQVKSKKTSQPPCKADKELCKGENKESKKSSEQAVSNIISSLLKPKVIPDTTSEQPCGQKKASMGKEPSETKKMFLPSNIRRRTTMSANAERQLNIKDDFPEELRNMLHEHSKLLNKVRKLAKIEEKSVIRETFQSKIEKFIEEILPNELIQATKTSSFLHSALVNSKQYDSEDIQTISVMMDDLKSEIDEIETQLKISGKNPSTADAVAIKFDENYLCFDDRNPFNCNKWTWYNDVKKLFESPFPKCVSYSDEKELQQFAIMWYKLQWLLLELKLHDFLNDEVLPLFREIQPDEVAFNHLFQCLFGLMCESGTRFPVLLKNFNLE